MVSLKVYNGEQFERSRRRYLWFAWVILVVVALSLFYKSGSGSQNIVGILVLLMIVGGYLFFLAKTGTEITLLLKSEWIQIGERLLPFAMMKGFVVEMEKKSWNLKNIVFVLESSVEIYTLKDTSEQQQLFFTELSKLTPFLENYEQGTVDKLMRRMKL